MRLLVDADACPNLKEVICLSQSYQIETYLFADYAHDLSKHSNAYIIRLDSSSQSADVAIENEVEENDIVITQDYGVALIALSKKAFALHPSGMIYKDENMDSLLALRFLNQKKRRQGKYTKGPEKRTKEDENNFLKSLDQLLSNSKRKE